MRVVRYVACLVVPALFFSGLFVGLFDVLTGLALMIGAVIFMEGFGKFVGW